MAIIKTGTYRFNDVLSASSTSWFFIPCNFIVNEPISTWDTNIFVGFHTYISEDGYFAMGYAHTPPAEGFDYEMFGLYSIYNSINAWGSKTDDQNARTITIPTDQEVSAEFAEWFTANAAPVVEHTVSGVWKFKDVLDLTALGTSFREHDINFTTTVYFDGVGEVAISCNTFGGSAEDGTAEYNMVSAEPDILGGQAVYATVYQNGGWLTSDYGEGIKTIDFGTTPQYVSIDFYNWLTANAVPVMASITHNGSTIAELFPGQTATLKCKGMKMEDDVVVAVAELPESGGSSYPNLGALYVTENGTYNAAYEAASFTWDENTEYDGTLTVDGIALRYKKVASLTVPDDVAYLNNPAYSFTVTMADGTVQSIRLSDIGVGSADGVYALVDGSFIVVWVKDATYINAGYGASLEDNTVYITDFMWLSSDPSIVDGATLTLTAPGKKLDGISSVTVDVTTIPDGYIQPSGTMSIGKNGTYDVTSTAEVVVDVPNASVVGVWKFNDDIAPPIDEKYRGNYYSPMGKLNFVCNSKSYIGFSLSFSQGLGYLSKVDNNTYVTTVYYNESGWWADRYKTIDFGRDPQTVHAWFLEWLEINATRQSDGPVLQEKTATENGEVFPDEGYDGLSKVTVNVPAGSDSAECNKPHVIEVTELPVEDVDTTSVYKLKKLTDIWLGQSGRAQSLGGMFTDDGYTLTFYAVSTKPTENIVESDMLNKTVAVYYMEDENEVFFYADMTGSGATWIPMGIGLFNGEYICMGAVESFDELTEMGYYAYFGECSYHRWIDGNWRNYTIVDDYEVFTSNGEYDVTKYYKASVEVPTVVVAQTVADLPTDHIIAPPGTMAIVLEGGN